MALVLQALVQPGLVYRLLASGGPGTGAGPLVSGLDPARAAYYALVNPKALIAYVNQTVLQAEQQLPEGARVQLEITGWTAPLIGSLADQVADRVNQAFVEGRIRHPDTGETVRPWPEHPDRIAFAVGDTVVLRWVKSQPWYFWITVGMLLVIAGVWIYLSRASWSMWFPHTPPSGTGTVSPTGLPWYARAAIVAGLIFVTGAYIWYRMELRLREAGAPKQTFIIER